MSENELHGLYLDRDSIEEDELSEIKGSESVWTIDVEDGNSDVLKRVLPPDLKSQEFRRKLDELERPSAGYWHPDTRYLIEESGMVPAFSRSLNFVKDEEALYAILSEGVEFLLDILEESGRYLTEDYQQLSEIQTNQMNTELLLSANKVMIPNYSHGETWERILSLREHTSNLSLELSQKKKSLIVHNEEDREEVFPVEPDTTANLVGLEVEKMAGETIERKKTLEFFREEVGVNYSLAPEPEMVLLVLQSGYLLLESGKILNEHRPDKVLRERSADVAERVRQKIPSERIQELKSDDEVTETVQAELDEWDSN